MHHSHHSNLIAAIQFNHSILAHANYQFFILLFLCFAMLGKILRHTFRMNSNLLYFISLKKKNYKHFSMLCCGSFKALFISIYIEETLHFIEALEKKLYKFNSIHSRGFNPLVYFFLHFFFILCKCMNLINLICFSP